VATGTRRGAGVCVSLQKHHCVQMRSCLVAAVAMRLADSTPKSSFEFLRVSFLEIFHQLNVARNRSEKKEIIKESHIIGSWI
jgi:hypothetical protein